MNIFSHTKKHSVNHIAGNIFWFCIGVTLGLFLVISFVFIFFQKIYSHKVYPGVIISGVHFGGKTQTQVRDYFLQKNKTFGKRQFIFLGPSDIATVSAQDLNLGYDEDLLAKQAYSIGRSSDVFSNSSIILQAYMNNLILPASYHYDDAKLEELIHPIAEKIKIDPINAVFTFENGRVTTFHPSSDGQTIDMDKLKDQIAQETQQIPQSKDTEPIYIHIPVKVIKPDITTEKVNNYGIKELIGVGTSLFQGSIPSRIHNVTLGASRVNGALIAPGEEFSFDKTVGDVSALTGYKQAYVIENGKTVLGDGGGICQVSTTLFRAALNAGLPITERHAHAYRVHYYEEDSGPGIDATVYTPTVDLKFKNDTGNYILIQTVIDPDQLRLTFYLYGTKDNREVTISDPVVASQSPAPEAVYQDDPTLPAGTIKQIDFSAAGANVYFTRQVKKDGKVIIDEKYTSNYRPWQAIFLRGTKT
jgi:vancomycin resistance protein YoaR